MEIPMVSKQDKDRHLQVIGYLIVTALISNSPVLSKAFGLSANADAPTATINAIEKAVTTVADSQKQTVKALEDLAKATTSAQECHVKQNELLLKVLNKLEGFPSTKEEAGQLKELSEQRMRSLNATGDPRYGK